MKALFHVAFDLQKVCLQEHWKFCFIGGIALQRWAEPRLTRDVDLTILTGFGDEATFLDVLLKRFPGRMEDAREFALQHRVLLLQSKTGIPIDVSLGGLDYERKVVDRAIDFEFLEGITLRICTAEDLIVFKAFADRSRDWADVESVIGLQANRLDWSYIEEQLAPLVMTKDQPEILDRLKNLRS